MSVCNLAADSFCVLLSGVEILVCSPRCVRCLSRDNFSLARSATHELVLDGLNLIDHDQHHEQCPHQCPSGCVCLGRCLCTWLCSRGRLKEVLLQLVPQEAFHLKDGPSRGHWFHNHLSIPHFCTCKLKSWKKDMA